MLMIKALKTWRKLFIVNGNYKKKSVYGWLH